MPTLSLRVIKKPRKIRRCDTCFRYIDGETIRLYGMAFIGEKPYQVFLHRNCVSGSETIKLLQKADSAASNNKGG